MKKNIIKFLVFMVIFYGLWTLVFPVFFFLPLILLLLYIIQQQFDGGLQTRATLSVLCAVPFLVVQSVAWITAGSEQPVMDFLLLLTWAFIIIYWVAAMLAAVMLQRSKRHMKAEGQQ